MLRRALIFCVAIASASALALATPYSSQAIVRSLMVVVGERVTVDVDYKAGYACDDISILRAWMTTEKGHNYFVVEGTAPGRTWCRVGMIPGFGNYLFDVTVVQRKAPPTRPLR